MIVGGIALNIKKVKLSNDCGESQVSDALNVLVKNSYSVDENKVNGIGIYPNPANNQIVITGISDTRIEICNPLGQVLMQAEVHENDPVDISGLQSGIYFIRVISSETVCLRFVKTK